MHWSWMECPRNKLNDQNRKELMPRKIKHSRIPNESQVLTSQELKLQLPENHQHSRNDKPLNCCTKLRTRQATEIKTALFQDWHLFGWQRTLNCTSETMYITRAITVTRSKALATIHHLPHHHPTNFALHIDTLGKPKDAYTTWEVGRAGEVSRDSVRTRSPNVVNKLKRKIETRNCTTKQFHDITQNWTAWHLK